MLKVFRLNILEKVIDILHSKLQYGQMETYNSNLQVWTSTSELDISILVLCGSAKFLRGSCVDGADSWHKNKNLIKLGRFAADQYLGCVVIRRNCSSSC